MEVKKKQKAIIESILKLPVFPAQTNLGRGGDRTADMKGSAVSFSLTHSASQLSSGPRVMATDVSSVRQERLGCRFLPSDGYAGGGGAGTGLEESRATRTEIESIASLFVAQKCLLPQSW